jgi:hypothetical protein
MIGKASENQIRHNSQIKMYPDGTGSILCLERALIRAPGWEEEKPRKRESDANDEGRSPEERAAESAARAQRRAKTNVYDLAMSNPLDWFVTLTVAPDKLNRYDSAEVFRHLHDWLDNRVRRNGLLYVLIPELHKDGAIHFHALINDALPMTDSGTVIPPGGGRPRRPRSEAQRAAWISGGGQPVYNLPAWGWGFSSAIKLHGDRGAAVGYVSKYITKSRGKIGGRWYYSGGRLKKPDKFCADLDYERVAAASQRGVFEISDLGCKAVKIRTEGQIDETLADFA